MSQVVCWANFMENSFIFLFLKATLSQIQTVWFSIFRTAETLILMMLLNSMPIRSHLEH